MNIWHDINPALITPEVFTTLIEIPKGSKCKYELDKHTGLLRLTVSFTHPPTIPPTTVSFPVLMPTTATRSTFS